MKTEFALLCNRCGLSQNEAAQFLKTRLDTVKAWSSGRRAAPEGPKSELALLYSEIESFAARVFSDCSNGIEIAVMTDDMRAQELGLQFASSHQIAIGLVVLMCRKQGWQINVVSQN